MRMIDADALQELCDKRIQEMWNSKTAPVSWAHAYADFKDDVDPMPTLTQPNEPLTIAQLREMDGEPVYWPKEKIWLIVYLNHPDFGDCALNREGLYLPLDKCERRKVYRRPPEGEESKLT